MPRKQDPEKALVDQLFDWHQPKDDTVAGLLTATRAKFKSLANHLLKSAPPSDARTQALHALHAASQATIFAIVSQQEVEPPTEEP